MHKLFGSIAVVLIVMGALFLAGLGYSAFMVVKHPEEFELSRLALSSMEITEPLLSGRVGDKEFVLNAAKPLRYVFFGFIGLFLISMMVSISNAMIIGGIRLSKYAAENTSSENSEHSIHRGY